MTTRLRLNLALQGGGAHGAFTWGVLERLLEEPDIEIDRISGTSAGALNGAALAAGFAQGGREGAQKNLAMLWRRVAETGALMTLLHTPLRKPGIGGVWDDATPLLSPYQSNPLSLEPLRFILNTVVDVEALQRPQAPRLFVNAVSARTGRTRVFGPEDLSIDALMASACAPLMFPSVLIDGEPYWDGSYAGNPMLWPLHEGMKAAARGTDILLVELTPRIREDLPITAKNILNRINEIASINGLVAELREVDRVNQDAGRESVRLHCVSLPEESAAGLIEPSTKRTIGLTLFASLKKMGADACEGWLRSSRAALGKRSSFDYRSSYLVGANGPAEVA
jgi:NTE family protein